MNRDENNFAGLPGNDSAETAAEKNPNMTNAEEERSSMGSTAGVENTNRSDGVEWIAEDGSDMTEAKEGCSKGIEQPADSTQQQTYEGDESGSEGEYGYGEALQEGPEPDNSTGGEGPGKKKKFKNILQLTLIIVLCIAFIAAMVSCSINRSSLEDALQDYDELDENCSALEEKNEKLENEIEELEDENKALEREAESLESEIEELEGGAAAQLVEIRNAYEAGEWQNVIDLAAVLHESYNGTDEDIEAQELAAESQEKLDEEAEAAAEEAAKGYETGITYEDLARYPDEYYGMKVKLKGKVVQSVEDDDNYTIRLAVDSDYDQIILGYFDASILDSRLLEDDIITIYGYSVGTISYESVLGASITVPGVYIQKIDQ